jgi:hypothetical protein
MASGNLERSASSLADLVQLILESVNLPFDLLIGGALRRDEQATVFTSRVPQESRPDRRRIVRSAWLSIEFKGAEDVHELISYLPDAGL